jgi:hypothetical protein
VRSWWLVILMFAFVAIAGSRAEAQVFKPRGKAGASKSKKAPPEKAKAEKPDPPAKKAAARPTPKKKTAKKSRAADSGRPSDLTPASKKGKKGKKGNKAPADDDEDVASADDGDDEVIITDDDD